MEKSEFRASREFVRGAASLSDLVFIISKAKILLKQGVAHTSLIAVYQGQWADGVDTAWEATAIAPVLSPTRKQVLIGEDGDVALYLGGGKSAAEKITPKPVLIRNARNIAGLVYVCGMKRQVYKRRSDNEWQDISAPPPKEKDEVGFEAIDGYSENEIYAVGWQGEIWQYDGSDWTARISLTKLILTAVCCAPSGEVYTAGQKGVLLRGRNDKWQQVRIGKGKEDDFWDLCWFNDKLYVATVSGLYTLEKNELVEVDFGEIGVLSCYSLTSAEGVLWSIGRNDVARFDGKNWTRID